MTWTIDSHRPTDRAQQARKHEGPYYGEALRRVLAPEPTEPSLMRRVFDWYDDATASPTFWRTLAWLTVAAVFVAALIVIR